ncbi:uncharacterized protein H6S33_012648 [Morchella sextelata]|uniref:uncharacterized protein n=1 Tax=Morchella sextelata TaxID=1174677 RepID=UPI001D04093E|nr:uncharacterized protein H6S33_012648 [Morchella sextelata]KAH0610102.1 hypothetical protein H6S33_012648 [Morchella sextelata]
MTFIPVYRLSYGEKKIHQYQLARTEKIYNQRPPPRPTFPLNPVDKDTLTAPRNDSPSNPSIFPSAPDLPSLAPVPKQCIYLPVEDSSHDLQRPCSRMRTNVRNRPQCACQTCINLITNSGGSTYSLKPKAHEKRRGCVRARSRPT